MAMLQGGRKFPVILHGRGKLPAILRGSDRFPVILREAKRSRRISPGGHCMGFCDFAQNDL